MENKEEAVYLYAGVINTISSVLYWKNEDNNNCVKIGDYAVVENVNGYNLIRVVGVTITTQEEVGKFTNKKSYEKMKKIIKVIPKEELEVKENFEEGENNV